MQASRDLSNWRTHGPDDRTEVGLWLSYIEREFQCTSTELWDVVLQHLSDPWVPALQAVRSEDMQAWIKAYRLNPLGDQDPHKYILGWCYGVCGSEDTIILQALAHWATQYHAATELEIAIAIYRHSDSAIRNHLQALVKKHNLPAYS